MKTYTLAGAVMTVMAFASMAGAQGQTWEISGGTYTFGGCSTAAAGIQCRLTFLQTDPGEGTFQLDPKDVQATSDTGRLFRATRVNVAGQGFTGPNAAPSTQGTPIDILFELGGLPAGTKSIRTLIIEGHKLDNVIVGRGGASGAMTPPRQGEAPGPQNIGIPGGFNVQYTDCRFTPQGLTCTATFTLPGPAR
jgi:hypothetical protein